MAAYQVARMILVIASTSTSIWCITICSRSSSPSPSRSVTAHSTHIFLSDKKRDTSPLYGGAFWILIWWWGTVYVLVFFLIGSHVQFFIFLEDPRVVVVTIWRKKGISHRETRFFNRRLSNMSGRKDLNFCFQISLNIKYNHQFNIFA